MGMKRKPRRPRAIAVAVDLTAASAMAVVTGVRMVHRPDALHIVHTVQPAGRGEEARLRAQFDLLESDPERVRAYFRAICQRTDEWPRVIPYFHTRFGGPVDAILQFTADVEADLLICGTHARHGMARWLHGSVAEQLVRDARCPVLVARSKDYREARKSEVPDAPCDDCSAARVATGDRGAWCELHAREHVTTHIYSGSGSRGSSSPSFDRPN